LFNTLIDNGKVWRLVLCNQTVLSAQLSINSVVKKSAQNYKVLKNLTLNNGLMKDVDDIVFESSEVLRLKVPFLFELLETIELKDNPAEGKNEELDLVDY